MLAPETLNILFPETLAIIISIYVGNYNFLKLRQLKVPEMLAIIFVEMMATNVSNCVFENSDDR